MLGIRENLKRNDLWLIAIMCAFTFWLYYPSLSYDFIHSIDDDWLLKYNPFIKDFSLKGIYNLFFVDNTDFHYHPVTYLSLMLDYKLFGLNPMGYKIHNLLLHLACGGMTYLFLISLTKNRFLSFFVAFIFLIHPVNMESIVWASCRRQSLFYLYVLIALYLYLQCCLKSKNSFFVLALIFAIIASLTKATAIVFPFLFLIIYFVVNQKLSKTSIIHFLITLPFVIGLYIINENINLNKSVYRSFDYSFITHLVFYGYSYFFYWVKSIFLFPQGIFYPSPPESLTVLPLKYYLYALSSVFILFLHFYHFKKREYLHLFSLLYFSISIAAMLNLMFFPLGDMPMLGSNRYFYHSCLGILLYFGLWIDTLFKEKMPVKIIILVFCSVLCSVFFRIQLPVWANSIDLMSNTVKYYPSEEIMYRLAIDYYLVGDKKNAFKYMDNADNLGTNIWINNDSYYYCQRALIYYEKGDCKRVIKDLKKAKSKNPDKKLFNSYLEKMQEFNFDSLSSCKQEIMSFYME